MIKKHQIRSFFASMIVLVGFVSAQTGTQNLDKDIFDISPLFNSTEMGEGIMFAGCSNSINFDFKKQNIKELHIELDYNVDEIAVEKVLLSKPTPKTWYRIENNQIVFTQRNKSDSLLSFDGTIFSFLFQSKKEVFNTSITLNPNSYYIDKNDKKVFLKSKVKKLTFSEVGECNPDVVAPFIKLISPKEDSKSNKNNSKVILKISDNKAGVNWEKLDIVLDKLHYKLGNENVKKDGNILTITPVLDFEYGTSVNLSVVVEDKALKPNKVQKIFSFETTADTPMCKELGCNVSLGRQITSKECIQFQKMFLYSDTIGQKSMKKLFGDLGFKCDLNNMEALKKIVKKDKNKQKTIQTAKTVSFSLFSMLGWILFGLAFVLKLRYIRQYKKLKKSKKIQK